VCKTWENTQRKHATSKRVGCRTKAAKKTIQTLALMGKAPNDADLKILIQPIKSQGWLGYLSYLAVHTITNATLQPNCHKRDTKEQAVATVADFGTPRRSPTGSVTGCGNNDRSTTIGSQPLPSKRNRPRNGNVRLSNLQPSSLANYQCLY
jgi:hypothetical protein